MEDFLIKKGYSIELLVEQNDKDFLIIGKQFINKLDELYIEYINNLEIVENDLKPYLNNDLFHFKPEILSKQSPLTLIDGAWGSGKTYFIESIIKNFIDKKIESKIFEKIIVIDAWKFSNSKNIPDELMAELFEILSKFNDKLKIDLKNIAKFLFNTSARPWMLKFGIDVAEMKIEEKYYTLLNKINAEIPKVIIFFDNIERLGNDSWELLKAILKLSEFKNFIFVLPMNIKQLKNNQNIENNEYPIEKYIDLPYFKFHQDYKSLLKNLKFESDESEKLNTIFEKEIAGEKLSIREVEQRIKNNDILNINSKYEKIRIIIRNIWGATNEAKKIIKKDLEIYQKYLYDQEEIYDEFVNLFYSQKKYLVGDWQLDEHLKLYDGTFIFTPDFDYIDNWKNINKLIEEIKIEVFKKIKKIKIVIDNLNQEIEAQIEKIKQIETTILKQNNCIANNQSLPIYFGEEWESIWGSIKIKEDKIENQNKLIKELDYVNNWNDYDKIFGLISSFSLIQEEINQNVDSEILNITLDVIKNGELKNWAKIEKEYNLQSKEDIVWNSNHFIDFFSELILSKK